MLRADLVPRSHDAALQEAESVFHGVGMDVSSEADIFLLCVIHRLMAATEFTKGLRVGCEFVSHNYINILRDVFLDVSGQSSALCIFGMKESQLAIALPNTNHDRLVGCGFAAPRVALLPPNVGFVHLNGSIQHWTFCFFHRSANPVTEIPSRFVTDSDSALHLVSGETFACFHEQEHSGEPSHQGKMGIVEDGSGSHGEMVFALSTVKLLVGLDPRNFVPVATWAFDTSGPAQFNQNFPAFIIGIEQRLKIKERHG